MEDQDTLAQCVELSKKIAHGEISVERGAFEILCMCHNSMWIGASSPVASEMVRQ